jgi:hypothetical protein
MGRNQVSQKSTTPICWISNILFFFIRQQVRYIFKCKQHFEPYWLTLGLLFGCRDCSSVGQAKT